MKTNTILTITTALGNVAVLAGLVFLIIEMRQTSSIARSEIRQDRSNAMIEEFSQIYSEDSVLLFIWLQWEAILGQSLA